MGFLFLAGGVVGLCGHHQRGDSAVGVDPKQFVGGLRGQIDVLAIRVQTLRTPEPCDEADAAFVVLRDRRDEEGVRDRFRGVHVAGLHRHLDFLNHEHRLFRSVRVLLFELGQIFQRASGGDGHGIANRFVENFFFLALVRFGGLLDGGLDATDQSIVFFLDLLNGIDARLALPGTRENLR